MSDIPKFPLTLPGGEMMPYLSARRRTEVIDLIFEWTGGPERLRDWVNKNDDNYKEYITKMWAKGAARAVSHDLGGAGEGIEAALKRLDAAENAKVINGTASRVQDDVVDVPEDDS